MNIPLIDADSLVYKVGFSCGKGNDLQPLKVAKSRMDSMIAKILTDLNFEGNDYSLYLTTDRVLAREKIAKYTPYKGNRVNTKPPYYLELKDYLVNAYAAICIHKSYNTFGVYGCVEADDCIFDQVIAYPDKNFIICHIDKDLDQIPGTHYNYTTGDFYEVTQEEADYFLWQQVLTGDLSDNVVGLRGIGPVKAQKILDSGIKNNEPYFETCALAYFNHPQYKNDVPAAVEHLHENIKLLRLGIYEDTDSAMKTLKSMKGTKNEC